jgi:glutaredoxin
MAHPDETRFRELGRRVPPGTRLRLATTADSRSSDLSEFCRRLSAWVPQVSVLMEETADGPYPFLILPSGVRYMGVPAGTEVEPFVDALASITPPRRSGELAERLKRMGLPAAQDLNVIPECRHCPEAVRRLMPLAEAVDRVRLTVIDGALFQELAQRQGIRAAPTLLLDGQFRWTGSFDLKEVVALMETRDPVSLGPSSIELMLKEGAARRVAQLMAGRNALFPAIVELLCREQWPVRLGAMVAVEELYALRPELARQVIEPLWDRFEAVSEPVKGDILYVFGEIGKATLIPRLTSLLQAEMSAGVRDAAAEALAKLSNE